VARLGRVAARARAVLGARVPESKPMTRTDVDAILGPRFTWREEIETRTLQRVIGLFLG
jgi:hypothetical protein